MATGYRDSVGYHSALTYRGTHYHEAALALTGVGSLTAHAIAAAMLATGFTGAGDLDLILRRGLRVAADLAGTGDTDLGLIAGALLSVDWAGSGVYEAERPDADRFPSLALAGTGTLAAVLIAAGLMGMDLYGFGYLSETETSGRRSASQPFIHVEVTDG